MNERNLKRILKGILEVILEVRCRQNPGRIPAESRKTPGRILEMIPTEWSSITTERHGRVPVLLIVNTTD